MRPVSGIKPQDVLVILKIVSLKECAWRQQDLASQLGISQAEVNFSLERLRISGLIDDSKKKPFFMAIAEFLIYAVKYIFPPTLGGVTRGIPTAHAVGPLAKGIVTDEFNQYVWPDPEGTLRGISLSPIYPSVPSAAKKDLFLHELLALVDSIRVGRAREKSLAADEIKNRLMKAFA